MGETKTELSGPGFGAGVAASTIADGVMLLGHAKGEPVLLARRGDELFAVGATCTHDGAPLADGLLVEDTVRCPWHHACFSLRKGQVLRAPALDPIACGWVEQIGDVVYVREKLVPVRAAAASSAPHAIVIIGSGSAGNVPAQMLRQLGYAGSITILSADISPPYDRPNLSKGELSGSGAATVTPPRSIEFYRQQHIDLKLDVRTGRIDTATRQVELGDGSHLGYDALLLATGADPVRLDLPGADLPHVHYLRSRADCDALIAGAQTAKRAVVVGASFIGLEVASSLSARGLEVQLVGLEPVPMENVLGPEVGGFIRRLHEQHGAKFHLGTKAASIDASGVTLQGGERLDADLVVIGVGVRPNITPAEQAGLDIDRGVRVDEYLETSAPSIFAAGDIARWPDPAQWRTHPRRALGRRRAPGPNRTAQHAGGCERFGAVPFFWTEQSDFGLALIGHAEHWGHAEIEGDLEQRDWRITYSSDGGKQAVAVIPPRPRKPARRSRVRDNNGCRGLSRP